MRICLSPKLRYWAVKKSCESLALSPSTALWLHWHRASYHWEGLNGVKEWDQSPERAVKTNVT
jgi:hypothetical protein